MVNDVAVITTDRGFGARIGRAVTTRLGLSIRCHPPPKYAAELRGIINSTQLLLILSFHNIPQSNWRSCPLELLAIYRETADALVALDAGAAGIVHRDANPTRIALAAGCILQGDMVLPRSIRISPCLSGTGPGDLTVEDQVLLKGLYEVGSVSKLAARLNWSERHLRRRIAALCKQLGVDNRMQAIVVAARRGLL